MDTRMQHCYRYFLHVSLHAYRISSIISIFIYLSILCSRLTIKRENIQESHYTREYYFSSTNELDRDR